MERFHIGSKYEYCPNGNYWQEISGIFDRQIYLFCNCNKCNGKVYTLRVFDVTKKIDKEVIEIVLERNKLEDIKNKITIENMEKVDKLLDNNPGESQKKR